VTHVQEETTFADEVQRVQGGIKEHAATIAHQLQDVQIRNGYAYKRAVKLPLTTAKESFFNSSETQTIPEAALACTLSGNRYFGHWMTDDVTLTLAAQQLATPVRAAQKPTRHQVEYSQLLNVSSTPVLNARFEELIIIQDFGQNKFKRERYEYIQSQLKQLPSHSCQGVMLLRGSLGNQRSLLNENKVAEFLSAQGFTIIDSEKTPAREIVRQTRGTKIVVGVEGSQLVHGLFTMADGGVVLTLQPPYRFNNVHKDYADCLGLRYSFVVGKQVGHGFEINIEDLARTLDKINSTLAIPSQL
jgi:capsular polysaccharide biosynthesis protein